jgi:O-methyltransferase involved in polyketide biosynthesis
MELDPLSRTALIPFWARVNDGRSDTPVLRDTAAVALADRAEQSFERLEVGTSTQLGCCLRNRTVDEWVSELVSSHGGGPAAIVDIGVGLDTRLQRLPGIAARYIEIDSEPVLKLRNEWFPDTGAVRIVGDGMRVGEWAGEAATGQSLTIIVLEGVLTYQPPTTVIKFFADAAQHLPGAYVLFDSLSPLQAWMANRPAALVQERPRYMWATWRTRSIRAGRGRLRVHQERGFMDFPSELTRSFSSRERALHAAPPFRRSYRLTLAQLPGEGRKRCNPI